MGRLRGSAGTGAGRPPLHIARWLEAPAHHLLRPGDERYPALLREIARPPPELFVRGDPGALTTLQVAIVGSRNATRTGRETAHQFARRLASLGVTVTSGMANGIDTAAHRGALAGGGSTIAVLGTGIDRVYPWRNRALAEEIAEGGALVSEFPLGTPPYAYNFPRRNRLISGLCLGVIVVEANRRSGSLITAHCALEQGRELFAVPGSIHIPQSRGCHQLIREGARLVEEVDEILEELEPLARFQVCADALADDGAAGVRGVARLTDEEEQVMAALDVVPRSVDALVDAVALPVERVAALLVQLELKSLVAQEQGGFVRRVTP